MLLQRHNIDRMLELLESYTSDDEVVREVVATLSNFGAVMVLFARVPEATLLKTSRLPFKTDEAGQVWNGQRPISDNATSSGF